MKIEALVPLSDHEIKIFNLIKALSELSLDIYDLFLTLSKINDLDNDIFNLADLEIEYMSYGDLFYILKDGKRIIYGRSIL
jgi:hypothetical protein